MKWNFNRKFPTDPRLGGWYSETQRIGAVNLHYAGVRSELSIENPPFHQRSG